MCERARRLYLGLDGDPSEADAALARLLQLADVLKSESTDFAKTAVEASRCLFSSLFKK